MYVPYFVNLNNNNFDHFFSLKCYYIVRLFMFTANENRKISANGYIYSAAIMTLSIFESSDHKQYAKCPPPFNVDTGRQKTLSLSDGVIQFQMQTLPSNDGI